MLSARLSDRILGPASRLQRPVDRFEAPFPEALGHHFGPALLAARNHRPVLFADVAHFGILVVILDEIAHPLFEGGRQLHQGGDGGHHPVRLDFVYARGRYAGYVGQPLDGVAVFLPEFSHLFPDSDLGNLDSGFFPGRFFRLARTAHRPFGFCRHISQSPFQAPAAPHRGPLKKKEPNFSTAGKYTFITDCIR